MRSAGTGSLRSAQPAQPTRRPSALWLVVLLLAAGVVGMHSLGASHHSGSVMTAASMTAPHHATAAAADPDSGVALGAALEPALDLLGARTLPAGPGLAMCLAVLPLLALLLRPRRRADLGRTVLGGRRSGRAAPAPRRRGDARDVSLWRLCVLRT
ncbi:MAG: hypothetical protein ABJA89_09385 [Lapillicoccus sp.]